MWADSRSEDIVSEILAAPNETQLSLTLVRIKLYFRPQNVLTLLRASSPSICSRATHPSLSIRATQCLIMSRLEVLINQNIALIILTYLKLRYENTH